MSTIDQPHANTQRLRDAAAIAPAGKHGVMEVAGLTIHYNDSSALHTAYKDIFQQRIYHFESSAVRPNIIDGGAHIGLATLYWKQTHPGARITCFEPDAQVAMLLRRNLTENHATDAVIIEAGLSDQTGHSPFRSDGADGGRFATVSETHQSATVPTVRLSDHVNKPVDLLKLNIEGQEWPVLCDLEHTGKLGLIRKIILEYHGWPGEPQRLGQILNLLDRAGFRYLIHDFDRQTNPTTKPPFRIRTHAPWFALIYAERACGGEVGAENAPAPQLDWRNLRSVTPVSRVFGLDRGTPVDRHYIERFLACHAVDIRGRVLEVGDNAYTRRFGGDRVTRSDILHAREGNRQATIIGDLATGAGIPSDAFDCIILTQTLLCIEDVQSAIAHVSRSLAPGGSVLATVPGISQISRYDMERWGDWWRFTTLSARRLFEFVFGKASVTVAAFGNVLASTAFLHGLAAEDLTPAELSEHDPDYELLITIHAKKAR